METNFIIILFLIVYGILLYLNLRVFFYQRTLRKIAVKYEIGDYAIGLLYPPSMITMYKISYLRWVAIIALFFFSWKIAVLTLVLSYLLYAFLPEQNDYKNVIKVIKTLSELERKDPFICGKCEDLLRLKFILNGLKKELEDNIKK